MTASVQLKKKVTGRVSQGACCQDEWLDWRQTASRKVTLLSAVLSGRIPPQALRSLFVAILFLGDINTGTWPQVWGVSNLRQ
jgi:hypothetical protein